MVIQHRLISFLFLAKIFQVAVYLHCGSLSKPCIATLFLRSALIKDLPAFQVWHNMAFIFTLSFYPGRSEIEGMQLVSATSVCGIWKGTMPHRLKDSS